MLCVKKGKWKASELVSPMGQALRCVAMYTSKLFCQLVNVACGDVKLQTPVGPHNSQKHIKHSVLHAFVRIVKTYGSLHLGFLVLFLGRWVLRSSLNPG